MPEIASSGVAVVSHSPSWHDENEPAAEMDASPFDQIDTGTPLPPASGFGMICELPRPVAVPAAISGASGAAPSVRNVPKDCLTVTVAFSSGSEPCETTVT